MLKTKKIIVAITGSIAAYKAVLLVRGLIKQGATVRVIMTPSATQFVSPLTFSTLSNHPVFTKVMAEDAWNDHVEMGLWADLIVIAPLTANSLGKMANGICDSIVQAVYLSAKCPTIVAPAMDRDMWSHPSTQANIKTIQAHGVSIIPVGHGELASGLVGAGRMAEPEDIIAFISDTFKQGADFKDKVVVITAGPTQEAIDPVRFIGNHSSGKMGVALANAFQKRGATVKLILGPTRFSKEDVPGCEVVSVTNAEQMYKATKAHSEKASILIFAAAVADYKPKKVSDQKIKKKSDTLSLELERTVDIAASLGAHKRTNQLHVGFALETEAETTNALSKLERKNFDMIVLNSLQDKGAGFQHDTNKVSFFFRDGSRQTLPLLPKSEVAIEIGNAILDKLLNINI